MNVQRLRLMTDELRSEMPLDFEFDIFTWRSKCMVRGECGFAGCAIGLHLHLHPDTALVHHIEESGEIVVYANDISDYYLVNEDVVDSIFFTESYWCDGWVAKQDLRQKISANDVADRIDLLLYVGEDSFPSHPLSIDAMVKSLKGLGQISSQPQIVAA